MPPAPLALAQPLACTLPPSIMHDTCTLGADVYATLSYLPSHAARRRSQVAVSLSDNADDALALVETHRATVIVACGGGTTHENEDRPSLQLDQHGLLVGLSRAARDPQRVPPMPPLVVAVMAPGQVAVAPWSTGASAVAALFLAGQETGNAWADVLLGDVNPAGKLPVTFPLHEDDMTPPCEGPSANHCVYTERLDVGWRRLIHKPVGFAFGHGLSYTRFEYRWATRPALSNIMNVDDAHQQNGSQLATNSSVQVGMSVRVRNIGSVPGAEVAQLCARGPRLERGIGRYPLSLAHAGRLDFFSRGHRHAIPARCGRAATCATWLREDTCARAERRAPRRVCCRCTRSLLLECGLWAGRCFAGRPRLADCTWRLRVHRRLVLARLALECNPAYLMNGDHIPVIYSVFTCNEHRGHHSSDGEESQGQGQLYHAPAWWGEVVWGICTVGALQRFPPWDGTTDRR